MADLAGFALCLLPCLAVSAAQATGNVQFQDVDRTAKFDAAGNQSNVNFGTAIGIATPTRPPRVIQMSLRFNF